VWVYYLVPVRPDLDKIRKDYHHIPPWLWVHFSQASGPVIDRVPSLLLLRLLVLVHRFLSLSKRLF
jgi:hypothetical protein